MARGPQAPLPVSHEPTAFRLRPLLLQSQAEVPGGQTSAQTPPGGVGGGGSGQTNGGHESDPEGGPAGESGRGIMSVSQYYRTPLVDTYSTAAELTEENQSEGGSEEKDRVESSDCPLVHASIVVVLEH